MAFHCSELAFVFDNTDRCENMTRGGAEPRVLADKMSSAWLRFATTGDPNTSSLPHWPKVTVGSNPTMIFDRVCSMRVDSDKEERDMAALV
jgi:para-nitrobenzyl esterase